MRATWTAIDGLAPVTGTWDVQAVESRDGMPVTASAAFRLWTRLSIAPTGSAVLYLSDGSRHSFHVTADQSTGVLVSRPPGSTEKLSLRYHSKTPGHVVIEGTLDDGRFARMRLMSEPGDRLLVTRGFRWINEYPFNR